MFKGYPAGSDLTMMQTIYKRPSKDYETGKWDKGSITLVAKDNTTGRKIVETIDNPEYEFYFAKEDTNIEHNLFFIERDKVDLINVPYNDLEKKIAELTGNLEFYYTNIKEGNRYANRQLHYHNRVFLSDMNIEDFYRSKFNRMYLNNITEINRMYLDIEADIINMRGDFPELGECPINAVTLVNEKNNKVYTLLLRNKANPLIAEFEASINNGFFADLKSFIIESVGGWKQATRMGVIDLDYEIFFYDEEIELIQDVFNIINGLQPDFVLAWNMAFDIPYIIQRIINLGFNPAEIMCHPDFKYKEARYHIDEKAQKLEERGDFATISSYSIFLDQMIQFSSRRKGQSAFRSYSLDHIGGMIAKVKKFDYKHITTDIAQFPYLAYILFVMYNIMDTIVQRCIEAKVSDMDYIFGKAIVNSTRYAKIHRQTVYLAERGRDEFLNDGFIMGNNTNGGKEKPGKFPGAFVADPKLLSSYSKLKINGVPVNIFDNTDDYDYARLYPSMAQESNMAPNTQIGMIQIPNQIHQFENRSNQDVYFRGGAFIEDLASQNYLEFCQRWLKLAGYSELYDDVIDYFTNIHNSCRPLRSHTPEGLLIPTRKVVNGELMKAVVYDTRMPSPIIRFNVLENSMKGRLNNAYSSVK